MYVIRKTTQFKKDFKRILEQGKKISKFEFIIKKLVIGEPLEEKYKDHNLIGNYFGYRECHIEPDWLLIYKVDKNDLFLARTGSHANLFS